MNKTENAIITYQINFERYKNGKANEVIKLLDEADSEISKYIKKTTGVYTKARYKEIAKKLKEISASLKKNVEDGMDIDGVIDYELKKQSKILNELKGDIKEIKGIGKVNFLYPSREQIKTAALFRPLTSEKGYGMTYQSYLDGIESGLFSTWDNAVRTGYLTGIPTKQIVRNVLGGITQTERLTDKGAINALRNSVYGNTRTVLQAFANETQRRVYEENDKYFGGADGYKYEYLATLDSRSCILCGSLDSKLYKDLKDVPSIPQHRNCVLGDTLVSSVDGISKVFRRRYKGLIYRIKTASGNVLSVTPNHPILTDKGFVRAHLLNIGDNVIIDNGLETVSIIGKNKDNRQVLIKDVFRTFSKSPSMFSCTMPLTAEDFHGDAVYNKVNIVTSNRELRSKRDVLRLENLSKNSFIFRFFSVPSKSKDSGFFKFFNSPFSAFSGFVGGFCKVCNLFWSRVLHSFKLLFVSITHMDIVSLEKSNHLHSCESKSFSDASNSDSLIVKFKNFISAKIIGKVLPRGADVGSMENISDDVFGDTELASNILNGYSAQIKVDSIVAIDVIKKKFCHVYNLETKNNWYIANGIITHNCRCMLVPHFDIEGDTRASKDGYVDAKTDFDEWLRGQDEKTQKDVLGAARFKMFQNGAKMTDFVDNGKVLKLSELENNLNLSENNNALSSADDFNKLSDYVNKKYGFTLDDKIKELNFQNVKDVLSGVEEVIRDFPDIEINKIEISKRGVANFSNNTLRLNPDYFKKTEEEIKEICNTQSKAGFWVSNSNVKSIGAHETGHSVEEMLINLNQIYKTEDERTIAWNECSEAKKIVSEAVKNIKKTEYGKGKLKAGLINSISRYANTNASETMAEAFADITANGNDANDLSKEIKRLTIERYKSYKNGGAK